MPTVTSAEEAEEDESFTPLVEAGRDGGTDDDDDADDAAEAGAGGGCLAWAAPVDVTEAVGEGIGPTPTTTPDVGLLAEDDDGTTMFVRPLGATADAVAAAPLDGAIAAAAAAAAAATGLVCPLVAAEGAAEVTALTPPPLAQLAASVLEDAAAFGDAPRDRGRGRDSAAAGEGDVVTVAVAGGAGERAELPAFASALLSLLEAVNRSGTALPLVSTLAFFAAGGRIVAPA